MKWKFVDRKKFVLYMYVFLRQDCSSGTYGKDCTKKCSEYCLDNKSCNHIDGACTNGCQNGYIGDICNACKKICKCNLLSFFIINTVSFYWNVNYIIFKPANKDVTAKTVHTHVPQIARHANILTVHAVVLQVGVDPIVVLVFMLLFPLENRQKRARRLMRNNVSISL